MFPILTPETAVEPEPKEVIQQEPPVAVIRGLEEAKPEEEAKPAEETKPAEDAVAEAKPTAAFVESTPTEEEAVDEAKPTEEEMAEEAKPTEEEAVDEAKPAEPGVVEEAKPTEEEIVEEAKPTEEEIVEEAKPAEPGVVEEAKPAEPGVEEETKIDEVAVAEAKPETTVIEPKQPLFDETELVIAITAAVSAAIAANTKTQGPSDVKPLFDMVEPSDAIVSAIASAIDTETKRAATKEPETSVDAKIREFKKCNNELARENPGYTITPVAKIIQQTEDLCVGIAKSIAMDDNRPSKIVDTRISRAK